MRTIGIGLFVFTLSSCAASSGNGTQDGEQWSPTGGTQNAGGATATGGATGTGAAKATGGATGTGGAKATGGATGTGAAGSGGTSGSGGNTVQACPGLDAGTAGVWENITPPGIGYPHWCVPAWNATCPGPGEKKADGTLATYGTNSVVVDPNNTAVVYLGTSSLGFFKSTDCGATWTKINSGRNGDKLDAGRQWTLQIDPAESETLYTISGYGPNGVFKSTNGGGDWDQVMSVDAMNAFAQGGFVHVVSMDPTDHLHLVVAPHFTCQGSHAPACLAETHDGGQTWKIIDGVQPGSEQGWFTVADTNTWFLANAWDGLFVTSNAGSSWTKVAGTFGNVIPLPNHGFMATLGGSLAYGTDGKTWNPVAGSGTSLAMVASKTALYASTGPGWNSGPLPAYHVVDLANPTKATDLAAGAPDGYGSYSVAYDDDHHILYSSDGVGGFWRIVTK